MKCLICEHKFKQLHEVGIELTNKDVVIIRHCDGCLEKIINLEIYITVCLKCGTSLCVENIYKEDIFIELFRECPHCPNNLH